LFDFGFVNHILDTFVGSFCVPSLFVSLFSWLSLLALLWVCLLNPSLDVVLASSLSFYYFFDFLLSRSNLLYSYSVLDSPISLFLAAL